MRSSITQPQNEAELTKKNSFQMLSNYGIATEFPYF